MTIVHAFAASRDELYTPSGPLAGSRPDICRLCHADMSESDLFGYISGKGVCISCLDEAEEAWALSTGKAPRLYLGAPGEVQMYGHRVFGHIVSRPMPRRKRVGRVVFTSVVDGSTWFAEVVRGDGLLHHVRRIGEEGGMVLDHLAGRLAAALAQAS